MSIEDAVMAGLVPAIHVFMARKIKQLASIPLLSSSAKADDPVVSALSVITGCPACAGHDTEGITFRPSPTWWL
jgi:hypothetical protein